MAAKDTVAIDPAGNTVKVDPATTLNVAVRSQPPVTGTVEVTKAPPVGPVEISKLPVVTVTEAKPVQVHVLSSPAGVRGLAWAVTGAGGRQGFNATIGSFSLDDAPLAFGDLNRERHSENPDPVHVALFYNPLASGVDVSIERISFGATHAGSWYRHRNHKSFQFDGDPALELNRGGGTNRAKAALYNGACGRGFDGTLSKVVFTEPSTTHDDDIKGSILLRPGQAATLIFDPVYGSNAHASVEFVWWEGPTEQ